ncbi:MAG: alpha/beta hydrolase-fold protein [Bacteroidia bacterium]|nr:alpha/beta hydrolase-fold protein [Bacteroidia bacterium]
MRKRLFILSAFMLAVMFASSQGTSTIVSFYSKSLHCKKQAVIYLPPGYADNDSVGYPVVYFLHGAGGNHESYEFIAKIVDELIFEKKIKPVIIVKPDASCPPYESSMYSNSTLYGNYEDFIVKDIISFTDSAH